MKNWQRRLFGVRRVWLAFSLILIGSFCTLQPGTSWAQQGGGNQGGQGGNQGGQGGQGGNQGNRAGGVAIDAEGVLTVAIGKEATDKLALKRLEAVAKETLGRDLAKFSALRKVSLVKLEQAVAKRLEDKQPLTSDMQFLAGLQRIDYVFIYPETGDLVIAGPAEGFAGNSVGRVVGVTTGRPPLRLDDLIVGLRVGRRGAIGCSIDPVPENHAKMLAAAKVNSGPATPDAIAAKYQNLTKILGNQVVTVNGVPADSHFAQVMIEADYRMKLMSVGREQPRVNGFHSQLDYQKPGDTIYQRWWFTPLYDSLKTTDDGDAYQFSGQRLQLLSQDEFISVSGQRTPATERFSSQKYAKIFTEKLPELAIAVPVIGELQNLTDIAILSALIRRENLATKLNWKMDVFLDSTKLPHVSGPTPLKVPSIGNWKRSGQLMLGMIGGVTIQADSTLTRMTDSAEKSRELGSSRSRSVMPTDLSTWWWD